jgi:2-oxoglutarate/2-oxoacid ferredoxin oxidoreductase subunit alpha
MTKVDMTVEICGMSGDGTIAAGQLLNSALIQAGLYLIAFDSYPAEIRGFGRCVTHSRVGDEEMLALNSKAHVLISLDDEQSLSRLPFLEKEALVLFDNRPLSYVSSGKTLPAHVEPEMHLFGIPFGDLASEAMGSRRGRNMVALGGFSGIFGLAPEYFHKAVQKKFGSKGDKTVQDNIKCFDAGYQYSLGQFKGLPINGLVVKGEMNRNKRILLSGNEAVAKGALAADLKFYYGYPITPATPVMEFLSKALPETGGAMMQMEDEMASIGAVIGSFFAGKRAMTATSGPGFALMTELIAHATMTETPAVIVNAQRGGPATGLPTKTEQSDLGAAVFGGPGDSARIVLAPTNVSECYHFTARSFKIAEKYQSPVILLTDFFLHNRVESVLEPRVNGDEVADGNLYPDTAVKNTYRRYEITESGISPRALPGMKGYIFNATGLEHSESGIPDYTPAMHMKMSEKRHRKIQLALLDLPEPVQFFTDEKFDMGVVAWGSTFGAALEAVKKAREGGIRVGALKITSIFPYHAIHIKKFMDKCGEVLIPELNFEGQLANLIGHLHRKCIWRLNQVTGIPMSANDILAKVISILQS